MSDTAIKVVAILYGGLAIIAVISTITIVVICLHGKEKK